MKRSLDIIVSSAALILLSPLLAGIALLILLVDGSPVFFRQQRPGFRSRPFNILKFKTMTNRRDSDGNLLSDGERMTWLGKLLRSSSLDELPELINVLKGEMSLVGPRPLLMEYLPRYSPRQARRHDVPPGVTGWAQINGRNAISWEDKFELDVWYVENQSFWLDLKILFLTPAVVLKRQGISAPGCPTATFFMGTEEPHYLDKRDVS